MARMFTIGSAAAVACAAWLAAGHGVPAGVLQASPGATPARAAQGAIAAQTGDVRPRFVDAAVREQAATPDLRHAVDALVAGPQSPAWIGYAVPAVAGSHGRHDGCCMGDCETVYLEARRGEREAAEPASDAAPDGPRWLVVLFRIERGAVQRVRVAGPTCTVNAGGLPLHWLTGVSPADSVALLSTMVKDSPERGRGAEPSDSTVLMAIAMHADPSAGRALDRFVATGQPAGVRKHAAFWLAAARGREGFETLRRLVRTESDAAFRKELVVPISLAGDPGAIDTLIDLARNDSSADVRKQALFWVSQKAGKRAASALTDAAAGDPDTAVKERAVFALSQLPTDESVPRLIDVARHNASPAVRKKAMFWLGQSNDPRVLAFFEEILKQ